MRHGDTETGEDTAEARMRQALGKLGTSPLAQPGAQRRTTHQVTASGRRHRFRQDGEVPVVRLALPQAGRGAERQAPSPVSEAGAAEKNPGVGWDQAGESARMVADLTEQLRAVQTRLGHAELALEESKAALALARAELAANRQEDEPQRHPVRPTRQPRPGREAQDASVRRKVGRPLGSTNRARTQQQTGEPEPVKWWAGD